MEFQEVEPPDDIIISGKLPEAFQDFGQRLKQFMANIC